MSRPPMDASPDQQRTRLTCDFCARTFAKAEHLIRHERSHTKSQPYQCTVCNRRFSRQDSLARHHRLHQRSLSPQPRDTQTPRIVHDRTTGMSPRGGVIAGLEVLTPARSSDHCSTFSGASPEWSVGEVGVASNAPPTVPLPQTPGFTTQSIGSVSTESTNHAPLPTTTRGMGSFSFDDIAMPSGTHPEPLEYSTQDDIDLWELLSYDLLPGSTSLRTSPNLLDILGLGVSGNRTPAPPLQPAQSQTYPRQDLQPDGSTPYGRVQSTTRELEHQPPPRPTIQPPLSAERLLPADRSPVPAERSQQALSEARFLISDLSSRVTKELSPLSSQWLDLCLQMFWKRFIPLFPVMHQQTFNVRATCAPLLLNMIAIGSLCLHGPDDRQKGVALWRLVHKGVAGTWDSLIEHRGPYDACKGTQLILTSALGQTFAIMSANSDLENTSTVFHGNGFSWAKLAGIFDFLAQQPAPIDFSGLRGADLEQAWAQWAARETTKRSVLAHYVLDGCLSTIGPCDTSIAHLFNPSAVAADDAMFAASTASAWATLYQTSHRTETFADIYHVILSPHGTLSPQSSFTVQTVLEGLYSLVVDWRQSRRLSSPPPSSISMQSIAEGLHRFYATYLTVQPVPLAIAARWHGICIEACKAIHTTTPGTDMFTLPAGRRALLHANALRQIAARLTIAAADMPHFSLPLSLYHAAKVLLHYLARQPDPTTVSCTVTLDEKTPWAALGTAGLESPNITPTPRLHNDQDSLDTGPASRRRSNPRDNTVTVQRQPWSDFIEQGGGVTLAGMELGMHDLYPLTTGLSVFGRVWPRSGVWAFEIQSRVL